MTPLTGATWRPSLRGVSPWEHGSWGTLALLSWKSVVRRGTSHGMNSRERSSRLVCEQPADQRAEPRLDRETHTAFWGFFHVGPNDMLLGKETPFLLLALPLKIA